MSARASDCSTPERCAARFDSDCSRGSEPRCQREWLRRLWPLRLRRVFALRHLLPMIRIAARIEFGLPQFKSGRFEPGVDAADVVRFQLASLGVAPAGFVVMLVDRRAQLVSGVSATRCAVDQERDRARHRSGPTTAARPPDPKRGAFLPRSRSCRSSGNASARVRNCRCAATAVRRSHFPGRSRRPPRPSRAGGSLSSAAASG